MQSKFKISTRKKEEGKEGKETKEKGICNTNAKIKRNAHVLSHWPYVSGFLKSHRTPSLSCLCLLTGKLFFLTFATQQHEKDILMILKQLHIHNKLNASSKERK